MNRARSTLADVLAGLPLFGSLDRTQLAGLAAESTRHTLARGELLFPRGTPSHGCYGVMDGLIQLSVSNPQGDAKVLEIVHPGESFGEAVMFLRRPYPVDATAIIASEVVLVPSSVIDSLLARDPAFARTMLAALSARLHTRVLDLEMFTLRTASQRVAAFLLGALADGEAGSVKLDSPNHVLASRLAMSPETFSRVLRDLVAAGLIVRTGRTVHVPHVPALVTHAT